MNEVNEIGLAVGELGVAVVAAGAKAQAAHFESGLAERDLICGGADGCRSIGRAQFGQRPRRHQRGAGERGGLDELTAAESLALAG